MIENYLNNRFLTLCLFPLILGSITVLSFEPFNLTFINFFVLPTFFFLIIYIKKKSKSIYRKKPYKKNLFLFGTSFGFGFYLSGIHWIANSLTFDDSFKIFIPLALVLIPLFLSLFFSLVVLIIGPFINLNLNSILLLSGGLAFSDFLRAKILTGFPWNLWAYSISWATELIQILNIIGLFAFNLIIISIFMFPAVLFFKINLSKKLLLLIYPIILFLIFYIYGNHSINQNRSLLKLNNQKFNIKVISPNFKLEYDIDLKEVESKLQKLIKYSEPTNNSKTLFVWPEGVFSGYNYEELLIFKELFSKNFSKNHFILFGVNKYNPKKNGNFNSLIIVNNELEILKEYHKQKLVPFGEFLPFEKLLRRIGLKKITEGHGSFLVGGKQENLNLDNLNILPLICYEVIFTKLIQKSPDKTNLIINISEDGWFGDSIGPYQHFPKGIFRAIEQNSFFIRSANKGISAIINNKGEIIKILNPNETGNIELEVPLIKNNNKNKNDLIFLILLITYTSTFLIFRNE